MLGYCARLAANETLFIRIETQCLLNIISALMVYLNTYRRCLRARAHRRAFWYGREKAVRPGSPARAGPKRRMSRADRISRRQLSKSCASWSCAYYPRTAHRPRAAASRLATRAACLCVALEHMRAYSAVRFDASRCGYI